MEDPLSDIYELIVFFLFFPFKDLPHVAGDSQLVVIEELDILAEKIAPPVPVFNLPPSLGSNVSDQVDRLALSLSAPHLPGDKSESNCIFIRSCSSYLLNGYLFVEALGEELLNLLNLVLRNLGNILHQKYRVSGQSLG